MPPPTSKHKLAIMSTPLPTQWAIRGFRLWLVVVVPILGFFGYHLVSSALKFSEGQNQLRAWVEAESQRESQGLRGPVTPEDVQFKALEHDFSQLSHRRSVSAAVLLIAIATPAIMFVVIRLLQWLWHTDHSSQRPISVPFSADVKTLERYWSAYAWGAGSIGLLVIAFFASPETAARTAISGVFQAIGVPTAIWLVMRAWKGRSR
jgi:hypothetical protein